MLFGIIFRPFVMINILNVLSNMITTILGAEYIVEIFMLYLLKIYVYFSIPINNLVWFPYKLHHELCSR